jgi:hypothetical protein
VALYEARIHLYAHPDFESVSCEEYEQTVLRCTAVASEKSDSCIDDVARRVTKRVRNKQSNAIIAADVRRFAHLINTDEVFGTHNGQLTVFSTVLIF